MQYACSRNRLSRSKRWIELEIDSDADLDEPDPALPLGDHFVLVYGHRHSLAVRSLFSLRLRSLLRYLGADNKVDELVRR